MNSIGYLVSFGTAIFGLLIGRFWKLLDYYNSKDRKLLEEILEFLPDYEMVNLSRLNYSNEYNSATYLFLAGFLGFCESPRVVFYNRSLERQKIVLVKLISELPLARDAFPTRFDDATFLPIWSIPNNDEGTRLITSLTHIYNEYVNFINISRKI